MDLTEVKERIELRHGDITEMEVDAIVSAANTDLILGAGVSGAIGRKGGDVVQQECDEIQSVPLGEAVATAAGALKARYVIHAASMEIGHFAKERNIERATRNALVQAEKLKLKTIALPAIGTGVAAFPADQCARVMLGAVARHLAGQSGLERVYFVFFDADTLEAFRGAFEQLGQPPDERPGNGDRGRRGRPRRGGRGPRDEGRGGQGGRQRPD